MSDNLPAKLRDLEQRLLTTVDEDEFVQALEELASLLLFDTDWSKHSQSLKHLDIIHDVPLVCKVEFCPYASKCDVLPHLTDSEREQLRDTPCRSERMFALRQFVAFVRDLSIRPSDAIDVQNVADLVRLSILKRRIDWQISMDGMIEYEKYVADNKGTVFTKRDSHPLLKEYERVNKQIASLAKQLVASRRDRITLAKDLNTTSKIKELFLRNKDRLPEPTNVVDVEFGEYGE
jgi:hypothetical protein